MRNNINASGIRVHNHLLHIDRQIPESSQPRVHIIKQKVLHVTLLLLLDLISDLSILRVHRKPRLHLKPLRAVLHQAGNGLQEKLQRLAEQLPIPRFRVEIPSSDRSSSTPLQLERRARIAVDHLAEAPQGMNDDVLVVCAVQRDHGVHCVRQIAQHAVQRVPIQLKGLKRGEGEANLVAQLSDSHSVDCHEFAVEPHVEQIVQRVAAHQNLQLLLVRLHRLLLGVELRLVRAQVQRDLRGHAIHRAVQRSQLALHFVQLQLATLGRGQTHPQCVDALLQRVLLALQLGERRFGRVYFFHRLHCQLGILGLFLIGRSGRFLLLEGVHLLLHRHGSDKTLQNVPDVLIFVETSVG